MAASRRVVILAATCSACPTLSPSRSRPICRPNVHRLLPEPSSTRVAVVVTCYNDGAALGEAVASLRHEPDDVELVVVDDGSTDARTLETLAGLERDGVRVIRQANQGQSAAAMMGLRSTSAPLVMRFDADDLLEPGAIGALADALAAAPDAAAAWGDVQTFGLTTFRSPAAPKLDAWLITYVNCVPGSGCLIRRAALTECGGWRIPNGLEGLGSLDVSGRSWLHRGVRTARRVLVPPRRRRSEHGICRPHR